MQSCAVKDGVIVSDHQGLFSSSDFGRQFESHELKVLSLFGLEIDTDLYSHQLQPVS
jgi:hypothetical protein